MQTHKKKSVEIIEGRTEWCKMERLHLASGFVAMTAGCVGTPWSWQCPHLWHHDTLGSKTVQGYEYFEGEKNTDKIWYCPTVTKT